MTRRDIILGGLRALGIVIVGSWPGDWLKVRSLADWKGDLHVYQAYAQASIDKLMSWYNPNTGLWNTTGWWNSANSLEALITYARLSSHTGTVPGNHQYDNLIENTYNQARSQMVPGGVPFSANYYDDELWWCIALIAAYDYLKEDKFLNAAITLFHDCGYAVDDVCGGGLWWDRQHTQKGSTENLLYIIAACRLYHRTSNWAYAGIAIQTWAWFQNSGLFDKGKLLVYDQFQANCQNTGTTTWTYNQGLAIGALNELSRLSLSGSFGYIMLARGVLQASLVLLTSDGILVEPCEPTNICSTDGPQFKGVFMRYIAQAAPHLGEDVLIHQFVERQVESLWEKARKDNAFGLYWAGPFDSADAARQTSALDAFNAAISLGL